MEVRISLAMKPIFKKKIDIFHHESIRRILGIRMGTVKEEKITNGEVRRIFVDVTNVTEVWRERQLLSLEELPG